MAEEYDYLFKSIVVGDGGVGKTALTLRFSKGFFTEDYKMTIGVDFHVKTINIDSNEGPIRAKLQIWDTGGQERFSSIRPMYYRGSLGALLIFDLTNSATFEHLPGWIEEVRANVKTEIPLLLVGNKSDLVDQRAVSLGEINEFTRNFNLFYMETSAKTGEGVGDCFYILACLMIGSGVPDQLIANSVVFSPGLIPITASQPSVVSTIQSQSDFEFSAPPVPEPISSFKSELVSSFEPEPEFEFEAPPVPEPSPVESSTPRPTFEPEYEPEIPIPEPKIKSNISRSNDFDFKTPEEILAGEPLEEVGAPSFEGPSFSASEEQYRPKTVPFATNVPVPAPAPEGFRPSQNFPPAEKHYKSTAPFTSLSQESQAKSDSLVDYMPEQVISKKERKKLEKQKKKEEKEKKIQQEQEMKSAKKEKKEKQKKEKKEKEEPSESVSLVPDPSKMSKTEVTSTPSLFQALTQKGEEAITSPSSPFVPFSDIKKDQIQEESKLRIIPDATDIKPKASGFTPLQSTTPTQVTTPSSNGKELIVCKNCGAVLSSDYAFCNKCGTRL
ncbi:MAG: GTP-binding protein [Promethearchaeota archaeon]